MPDITLPHQNLMCQWMAQHGVPAAGIGLICGDEITVNVYGELSKGITAPQNTIWGSKALADALTILHDQNPAEAGDAAAAEIFAGLDMPDTALGDPIAVLNRLARPHNTRNGIYVFKPYQTKQHLFTTVGDFCKLLMHINLQRHVFTLLNILTETELAFGEWKRFNGLPDSAGGFIHSAGGNGASHFILLLPQSGQALVIFTNSDNGSRVVECVLNYLGVAV